MSVTTCWQCCVSSTSRQGLASRGCSMSQEVHTGRRSANYGHITGNHFPCKTSGMYKRLQAPCYAETMRHTCRPGPTEGKNRSVHTCSCGQAKGGSKNADHKMRTDLSEWLRDDTKQQRLPQRAAGIMIQKVRVHHMQGPTQEHRTSHFLQVGDIQDHEKNRANGIEDFKGGLYRNHL